MPLIALVAFATPVHADTGLQLSYGMAAKHDKRISAPSPRADPAIYAPLRLEYELITHVERMTETTRELHAIIAAMPGPNLPVDKTPPAPPVHYASPLEETLARLGHVAQLIADITRIIEAMPTAGAIASANGRGSTATVSQPRPAIAALPVAQHPALPPPQPAPVPEPDNPILTTALRAAVLIGGGLVAAALGIHLRRWFMRKRPTRKQLAASIEPPPLRDEALELADVMISMGLAEGAIKALTERIRAKPRQALSHRLKLLDVYRRSRKQTEFNNAVEEIHTIFNVRPGSWNDNENNTASKASLEDYPHIVRQLENLWPTPECEDYLLSLLADNRAGTRTGFPVSAAEEIILLLAIRQAQADE